jgi:hypothetical protein
VAADIIIFLKDLLHVSNPAAILTASSTVSGYAIENVRRADLMAAWKGSDGTTNDEWLQVDGGSTTWLGAASATAYAVVAYDNRGADQDTILLQYDTADNPAFSSPSTALTWTISGNKAEVTMEWKSFSIPSTAKRYYRIIQPGNARTETTGSITAKILAWSMFKATDVIVLATGFPQDAEGAYSIKTQYRVGESATAGGLRLFNKYAQPGQRFTIAFSPASRTLWQTIRDGLKSNGAGVRAMYIQKDGLDNQAQQNFFMCRLTNPEYAASLQYRDNFQVEMEWETEPWL